MTTTSLLHVPFTDASLPSTKQQQKRKMSCFGLRVERASDIDLDPRPRRFRRNLTFSSRTSSESTPQPTPLPREDLSATKHRLVCIRRQSQFSSVSLNVGFKSRTGWQPLTSSKDNQDALAVVLPLPDPLQEHSLFAVFDGHGRAGHRVSAFVAESLVTHFKAVLTADKTVSSPIALRRACIRATRALFSHRSLDVSMTGTTASIAVIQGRTLTTANIGDSRIVIGMRKNGLVIPLPVTRDHLPEDPRERKRIEDAGGRVESWTPAGLDTGPPRVWLKDKRIPGLSVSRVIGDGILHGIVSSDPDMAVHSLTEEDRFMVVATDGVWGVMSNDEVVSFVAARDAETCQRISEELVRFAAERWFEDGGASIDDISAIVVRFNW